jgi:hypothetical protein
MARFDTIKDMTPMTTFAGWRFDRPPAMKITPDCETPQAAGEAILAYARREGLSVVGVEFSIIAETTNYTPVSKTIFTITTTTEPIARG